MIEREEMVMTTKVVYIAEDNTTFSNKAKCLKHEWNCKATEVFVVSFRGSRADAPELYSTLELAKEAVGSASDFNITSVFLDERLWRGE